MNQQPPPTDAPQIQLTLKYLEACNKIFENGLLSHDRVTDTNCDILRSIREGYDFFCNWHRSLVETGKNDTIARKLSKLLNILAKPNPIKPSEFLAWQSKVHV